MTLSARRNCGWNEVAASEWSEETSENDRATPLVRAGHRYFLPETSFAPVSGPRLSKLLSKFQSCARLWSPGLGMFRTPVALSSKSKNPKHKVHHSNWCAFHTFHTAWHRRHRFVAQEPTRVAGSVFSKRSAMKRI